MAVIEVRGVRIGEDVPKTIVPVMGAYAEVLVREVETAVAAGADCIEWRADFLEGPFEPEMLIAAASAVRTAAGNTPILFTVRTASQGATLEVEPEPYAELLGRIIESGLIDLVDIECDKGDELICKLIDRARKHGVATVVSYHNFTETPATEELVNTLVHMHELGANIPKMAVMPQSKQDTLRVLTATDEVAHGRGISPVITMAMGADGAISRLLGEEYGSAMTFCSVESASAPGQVGLEQTKAALAALHGALS